MRARDAEFSKLKVKMLETRNFFNHIAPKILTGIYGLTHTHTLSLVYRVTIKHTDTHTHTHTVSPNITETHTNTPWPSIHIYIEGREHT